MNHQDKLRNLYSFSSSIDDISDIPQQYQDHITTIADNVYNLRGVYTVLVTLLVHKTLFPKQDIRFHQENQQGGFAGRSIDTDYITPTLKELGLPSMAESGWLTRSLEQPYPYTLDYQGKIRNKKVKSAFLKIIDHVEKEPESAENILRILLNKIINLQSKNIIEINKISDPDTLSISNILSVLEEHFLTKYGLSGGSKLPVLAIYAVYQSLINEVNRYENKILKKLGSHTASDLTSRSSGDIEIFDENNQLFESVEIKHDKLIDITMVRIAYEKIIRFDPKRYYILSLKDLKDSDLQEMKELIKKIREEHGCQVILNGVIPTLKYYLRLIPLENFITNYSDLVENNTELKIEHKQKWKELIEKLNSDKGIF
jgi:DNA (cytosine-5)-methyltransferase 1